ncbi:sigma-70 family RNA polymerase sigma factor [Novosphingobium flavum]|uniref:Sigma-70 family RNA polymerase sigma factor n=1 Tax=Novosphingobium flavum TaxID=1778672 RepID=A0A7X1FQY3_9SPHN|nr:sigma-70 family RNA polymerase sigma factor [Novosphingobium flavum]MBC2665350.1 sigma-70 family RNA polymerase sigma factor [Novosphingobium flavum]
MASDPSHESMDQDAFGKVFLATWSKRYRRALLSFFRRRLPPGDHQEDLVQEVFLRLARRQNLHEIANVDGYIFQSASSVLMDWRRSQARRAFGLHDPIDETLLDVGATPERVILGRDALNRLIVALEDMPSRTQAIFILYHFEEKTHGEIGRALGIAIRTVEDHIARANRYLRDVVEL